jgi:hypothetical protein
MYKALGLIASTAKNRKRKEKKGGGREREKKKERVNSMYPLSSSPKVNFL